MDMRITDGTEICQVCGKVPSIIYCDSCEKPLCRTCRKFDMWQQGCGSIPTKVFCVACATQPVGQPLGQHDGLTEGSVASHKRQVQENPSSSPFTKQCH